MIYIAKDISKNALVHYGTKNMKWGVRKYQNEDGTLTVAGRERYRQKLPSKEAEALLNKDNYKKAYNARYVYKTVSDAQQFEQALKDHGADRGVKINEIGHYNREDMENAIFQKERDDRLHQLQFNHGAVTWDVNRLYAEDKDKYGEEVAKILRDARNSAISEHEADQAIASKMGKGSMPTSAISAKAKAENEAKVKASIPASAWNSKTSYVNLEAKTKASGLSTFMKKSLGK